MPTAILSASVQYQDNSIVSRMLMKESGGSVTLFAFGAGTSISEHTTPHEAMLFVVEGALGVTLGQESHTVDAGQMLMLPAHVPHGIRAAQRAKALLVLLKKQQ